MILIYESAKSWREIKLFIEYKIDGFYNNTDCGGSARDYEAEITGIYYANGTRPVGEIVWKFLTSNEDFKRRFQENLEVE